MKQNHFKTLGDALHAVREYVLDRGCILADPDDLFKHFTYGGVNYGETRRAASLLSHYRGKEIKGRMAKHSVTLVIYRMESGTYEAVSYIS